MVAVQNLKGGKFNLYFHEKGGRVPCTCNSSLADYWSFVKLYTFVVHYLQMCMKEYGCCPKFKRGDNSTYTFTKRGGCTLQAQLLLNCLLIFFETLHSCSTQPADVHEGIQLLSKIPMFEHHSIASRGYHSVRSLTVLVYTFFSIIDKTTT